MEGGRLKGEAWCYAMKNWLMFLINEVFWHCDSACKLLRRWKKNICNEATFASQMVKFAVMMPAVFLRPKVKERGDRTFPNCNSSRQRWKDFLQDNTVIFSQPPWLVPSWPFVGPSLVPDAAPMIPTLHGILTGTVFGNITEQWRVLWDSGFIAA